MSAQEESREAKESASRAGRPKKAAEKPEEAAVAEKPDAE